jgi:NADPH-dependent glutamate synthase beta subunit-like oxidoreductase
VRDRVNITLNGEQLAVSPGRTILEVARENGIFIPTLCHSDLVDPFASCFVCVVEIAGRPNLIPSCSTKVAEGMVIDTESERVKRARKSAIGLLVSDHVGDCLAPCMTACPAGIDIPGYIAHIAKGEEREALALIKHNMPFPGMLGRVCTRPCEAACRRVLVDEPIAICQLKRFPADMVKDLPLPKKEPATGKRVAIVGAGPAGLSAAFYLQILGHDCTVMDAHEAPGGMLRYGIPSYRLPRNIIDEEMAVVEALGATFKYQTVLGRDVTLKELRADYDAVFLALGAQKASSMRVSGEDLDGVLTGIGFLGEASRNERLSIGRRVVVVGGGNTAVDAARTAARLGAERVTILYRRTRAEMPAWEEEIDAAEAEGVILETLAAPVKVERADDGTLEVTAIRMELGEPDASGRRRPMPISGSEYIAVFDNVIAAIGQGVASDAAEGVAKSRWNSLEIDAATMQTNLDNVFAGGDCVTGADIAVTAVAAGRRAAISIDQYVMGNAVVGDEAPYNHTMGSLEEIPKPVYEKYEKATRVPMPHLPAETRAKSFDEVETGFTPEMAKEEAARCMSCGCRDAHECKLRYYAGLFGVSQDDFKGERRAFQIDESHDAVVHEASKCIQCGICVQISEKRLKTAAMGFVSRGFSARVQPALGRPLAEVNTTGVDQLVDNCPTGALTRKSDRVATLNPAFTRKEDGPSRR